jgi:hypothetical protein
MQPSPRKAGWPVWRPVACRGVFHSKQSVRGHHQTYVDKIRPTVAGVRYAQNMATALLSARSVVKVIGRGPQRRSARKSSTSTGRHLQGYSPVNRSKPRDDPTPALNNLAFNAGNLQWAATPSPSAAPQAAQQGTRSTGAGSSCLCGNSRYFRSDKCRSDIFCLAWVRIEQATVCCWGGQVFVCC